MQHSPLRRLLALLLAVSSIGLAAACGSSKGSGTGGDGPATLTVWLMKDSAPDAVISQINAEFHAAHPNVTVKTEILDWDGRDVKWKTALAGNNPPDVLEMGNTDVLSYASAGALADLTSRTFENSGTWLQGLKDAGTYNGKLYGVPYYGGDRVVIYRKDMWKAAGLTTPPATLAELQADGQKLAAGKGDNFSALYFPGRYQYAALPFVYDTGGSIAVQSGDKWTGNLSSPASQAGLTNWANFVKAVSHAPADADETNIADVFGQGHTSMIIGQGWMVGSISKTYPKIADQIGAFPMPGTNGPMPVFLGGSNLVASAGSKNAELAYEWIKLMSGTKYQGILAANGLLPNTTSLADKVSGITATELAAAAKSWFTPTSPKWSDVDNSKTLMDMFQAIASGHADVAQAAKQADDAIDQKLAGA